MIHKITFTLFLSIILIMTVASIMDSTNSNYQCKSVVVESGDTLWSIAAKHTSSQQDIRHVIVAIKQHNGIDKSVQIHPGQILQVPVLVSTTTRWSIITK